MCPEVGNWSIWGESGNGALWPSAVLPLPQPPSRAASSVPGACHRQVPRVPQPSQDTRRRPSSCLRLIRHGSLSLKHSQGQKQKLQLSMRKGARRDSTEGTLRRGALRKHWMARRPPAERQRGLETVPHARGCGPSLLQKSSMLLLKASF